MYVIDSYVVDDGFICPICQDGVDEDTGVYVKGAYVHSDECIKKLNGSGLPALLG